MVSKGKVKFIQSLKQKKYRLQNNAFVAEGDKLIRELLHSNITVTEVFATEKWMAQNEPAFAGMEGTATAISRKELQRLSFLKNPQEVLAVCQMPDWGSVNPQADTWNFYLDDLQDPGNLGTIIRTADWFGLETLFCSPASVDCFNPKVVQATMGSIARVKVVYRKFEAVKEGLPIYAAAMDGLAVKKLSLKEKGIIVIGNEAHGITGEILQSATKITIPRKGKAESLNAAMAAGIILHELMGAS